MFDKRKFRLVFFLFLLAALLLSSGAYILWEQADERSIGSISQDELSQLSPAYFIDLSMLYHHGQKAPADVDNNTIFLAQSADNLANGNYFSGLSCLDPSCKLYLLEDEALSNMPASVSESRPLSLIVTRGHKYQQISVMLTPLPILSLNCLSNHLDEEGTAVYGGNYSLFNVSGQSGGDIVQTGALEWHIRGSGSTIRPKKPWKLDIKKLTGKSTKVSFLNMGEDDDWILNPMIFDDLNVREKLAMDFWNTYICPQFCPYQMSCGEYIELFVDNEYRGLYLLQRRIDEEYLPIDRDRDIIFKGYSNLTEFAKVPSDYEIIYSPFDQEKTYELLIDALNFENGHSIDLDSFVNIELYLNYLHAIDNRRFKNTFFILRAEESGYVLYFLPWDTDLSLGIAWTDTAILSNLDMTLNRTGHRVEYTVLTESFSGLEQDIARQWQQMRGQIYQADKFIKIFEENRSVLERSGAPIRDEQKWGLFHSGTDTQEQMLTFINERLEVLDLHYQDILEK